MIKVLNILTDSNIGGAGRCLVNYLKYCDRSRFSVSVVLPRGSLLIPEIQKLDIPVIEAEGIAEASFSLGAIATLHRIIRAQRPDIVHTHGSLSGRISARLWGAKIVYTRHSAFPVPGYLRRGPGRWLNGSINNALADRIIAVSPATAENLTDSGVSRKKITVMMNGVEALPRSAPSACRELRQSLHLPDGVFTAGILARLEPYKGHMLLLDAARELADQGREFRILIGGSGSQEEAIRQGIAARDLDRQVLFLGFVQNVPQILSILDVQLNCSYGTEASSLALIEGMSLGLATVASDYGGNPWQVDDGITGLLFPSGSSHDLAVQIARLMDDPALLHSMQNQALEAYRTRFTGEIFAKNIESVYQQAIDRK